MRKPTKEEVAIFLVRALLISVGIMGISSIVMLYAFIAYSICKL